jgi:hypothetical protein
MMQRTFPKLRHGLAALFACLALHIPAYAQCDKVAEACNVELTDFLSDGQYYRAQVIEGETATLKVAFYEGFTYRIVACTDAKGNKIKYTLHDGSNAQVFSNSNVPDGTGWDFEVGSTEEFTIKASLGNAAGCIVFSIGYDDTMFMDDADLVEEDDPFFEDELSDEDYGLEEEEEQEKSNQ